MIEAINVSNKFSSVRMRLTTFEQLCFWYFIIKKISKETSVLKVFLNTDLLSEFMDYYDNANVTSDGTKEIKETGANTMYNHYIHFGTFAKWIMSTKSLKNYVALASQVWSWSNFESKCK